MALNHVFLADGTDITDELTTKEVDALIEIAAGSPGCSGEAMISARTVGQARADARRAIAENDDFDASDARASRYHDALDHGD